MPLSTTAKNTALDSLTIAYASLHNGDPGDNGANEISGGSPAYARKAVTFDAANAGERALNADVIFDVPASTSVMYVGYWTLATGGVYLGSDQVDQEDYTNQGQYKLLAAGTSFTLSDPV